MPFRYSLGRDADLSSLPPSSRAKPIRSLSRLRQVTSRTYSFSTPAGGVRADVIPIPGGRRTCGEAPAYRDNPSIFRVAFVGSVESPPHVWTRHIIPSFIEPLTAYSLPVLLDDTVLSAMFRAPGGAFHPAPQCIGGGRRRVRVAAFRCRRWRKARGKDIRPGRGRPGL